MSLKKLTVLAAALLVGLGSHALAAGRRSLTVELKDDTSLAGTKVPAGTYKFSWTAGENETEVKVTQGKKVVATGKAKRVEQPRPSEDDAVVSRKDASGAFALAEIRVRGEKSTLVLGAS
jgi:hypothetical protein